MKSRLSVFEKTLQHTFNKSYIRQIWTTTSVRDTNSVPAKFKANDDVITVKLSYFDKLLELSLSGDCDHRICNWIGNSQQMNSDYFKEYCWSHQVKITWPWTNIIIPF